MTYLKFNPFPTLRKTKSNTPINFFDELFNRNISNFIGSDFVMDTPAVNIIEKEDAYQLKVAAPGFAKSDFQVNIEKDKLTISVEKEEKTTEENEKYTRREFAYHSFKRSFTIPEYIDTDAIKATYKDGILSLVLPKKVIAKPTPKMIDIE